MSADSKSCQNCKFHATVLGADATMQTQCRYSLPEVICQFIPQGGGQVGVLSQRKPWPAMEKDDWCGKYEPQLN